MTYKSINIQITSGTATGPYNIYFDSVSPSNYCLLFPELTNAINISLSDLLIGVTVLYPDTASRIILYDIVCN